MRFAILGFIVVTAVIWTILEISSRKVGNKITKIIESGDYCTESTLHMCADKTYIVLTQEQTTLYQMAKTKDFSQYVHSLACKEEKFSGGEVNGQYFRYCTLARNPLTFSYDEKLNDAYEDLKATSK